MLPLWALLCFSCSILSSPGGKCPKVGVTKWQETRMWCKPSLHVCGRRTRPAPKLQGLELLRWGLATGFLLQSRFPSPPELGAFSSSKHCDGHPAPHRKKKSKEGFRFISILFLFEPDHIRNENLSSLLLRNLHFLRHWWGCDGRRCRGRNSDPPRCFYLYSTFYSVVHVVHPLLIQLGGEKSWLMTRCVTLGKMGSKCVISL